MVSSVYEVSVKTNGILGTSCQFGFLGSAEG